MASAVKVESRIPEIIAGLPLKVGAAIAKGTEDMAREAADRAPIGPHHYHSIQDPPGSLKDSIEARGGVLKYGGRSAFGKGGSGGVAAEMGFAVPRTRTSQVEDVAFGIWAAWYYRFVEFGTSHNAAQPFLIPAVEAHKDGLVAAVEAALHGL